jgi:hypothetical protein
MLEAATSMFGTNHIKKVTQLMLISVRFAHNWNVGIMDQWNDGFWKNGMMA